MMMFFFYVLYFSISEKLLESKQMSKIHNHVKWKEGLVGGRDEKGSISGEAKSDIPYDYNDLWLAILLCSPFVSNWLYVLSSVICTETFLPCDCWSVLVPI